MYNPLKTFLNVSYVCQLGLNANLIWNSNKTIYGILLPSFIAMPNETKSNYSICTCKCSLSLEFVQKNVIYSNLHRNSFWVFWNSCHQQFKILLLLLTSIIALNLKVIVKRWQQCFLSVELWRSKSEWESLGYITPTN